MNKNLEKLNQILELIKSNTVTPSDLRDFLSIILDFNKKSKESIEKLSEENLKTLAEGIRYLEKEHAKLLAEVDSKSERTVKDIEKKISQIADILEEVKAIRLQKPRDGVDGENGKDGKDGSPDTGEDIVDKINALPVNEANQIDASHIKNLPETKGGKGGSTARNLWQLQDYPLTTKGDIMTYDTGAARLGVGEDGQVLVADSSEDTGLKWEDPSFLASLTYMCSGTASGVGSYYSMPALGTYVEAAEASLATPGVSTTPTLIASFITQSGSPGVTTIPQGTYHFHIETEKAAGSNNYYCYAELYKRTAGGTETLLLTSDNSSERSVNTRIQNDVDGLLAASETLGVTDRLVVKWYAVMLSATATITTYWDNNTDARMEMPASVVDASNFVRKSGDTMSGDLNMGGNNISNVATIEIGAGATDTTLSRLSAGVLGVEGVEVPTATSTTALSNKTLGQTNTIDVLDTLFTISDNADTTKKVTFQVSGVTTGTTRTLTIPDGSSTIAILSTGQTFTGAKTFSASFTASGTSALCGTSTSTSTASLGSGATTTGNTKTVNIGTGGVAGSTTNITIGTNAGGTSNLTIDASPALGANSITMTGSLATTGARVTKGWFTDIESTNMPTVGGTPILSSLTAPQFTTIELGHASDTTLARVSAGVVSIEGNNIVTNTSSPTLATITTTGNIELGNASDTTISRSAAGVIAVEGVVVPTISSTNTLTNKRITPRITTITSSATPTINTDDCDIVIITALATAITSLTTNLSGTPTNRQDLEIYIKDDGTARAITPGASFASMGPVHPTTTTASKWLSLKYKWFNEDSVWGLVSAMEQP